MDTAKKMMEKWGWNKGQGLGKNKQGMASCLVLRKQEGSASQGRIMMAAPEKAPDAKQRSLFDPEASPEQTQQLSLLQQKQQQVRELEAQKQQIMQQQHQLLQQHGQIATGMQNMLAAANQQTASTTASLMASLQQSAAAIGAAPSQAPAPKRQRTGWDSETPAAPVAAQPEAQPAGGLFDIDPRDSMGFYDLDPRDAAAAAQAQANAELQAQLVLHNAAQGLEAEKTSKPSLAQPRQRVRVKQWWVVDDWRWSKGTEALRYFEEVSLAPSLLEMAKKILGPGSRYPARITDDTDCITEVTAWGTLLVRPRGTGANISLAKRMLYEILHPSGELLREEALITKDESAEAAVRDQSTIFAGGDVDEAVGSKLTAGVKRTYDHDMRRVGLGAEQQAMEESESKQAGQLPKTETRILELILDEDVALVKQHLDDLRMASGAIITVLGHNLKIMGKDRAVRKAEALANTLIATGEWVPLQDSFVHSEQALEIKRLSEGPAEQILIRIPDGPVTKKIEQHLKAIERAALAVTLKLTSKAVAGKRTLMVDGSKAAHERVKLMVKELSERGESAMLTKTLQAMGTSKGSEAKAAPPVKAEVKAEMKKELLTVKEEDAGGTEVAPGVIMARPVLRVKEEIKEEDDEKVDVDASATAVPSAPSKGLGPSAMRRMPAPKLKAEVVKVEDDGNLFAGLPVPEMPSAGACGSSAGVVDADAVVEPPVFPPLPPGLMPPPGSGGSLLGVRTGRLTMPKAGSVAAATAPAGAAGAPSEPPGLLPPGGGVTEVAEGITE